MSLTLITIFNFQNMYSVNDKESSQFSLFNNVTAKTPERSLSCEETYERVRTGEALLGDSLQVRTKRARACLENGDKAGYDKIKKGMPAISVHACFPKERRLDSEHSLSGAMMIDYDHLAPEAKSGLIERCKELPYVVMICESLSGQGVHLLVAYKKESMDEERFKRCYDALCVYLEIYAKEAPDRACKDIARLMIINHDPEAYFNPEAIPLDFSEVININNLNHGFMLKNEFDSLDRYLSQVDRDLSLQEGSRHMTMVSLVSNLNQAGFPENEVASVLPARYAQTGFPEEEIANIVHDVYDRYSAQHGANRKSFECHKDKWTGGQIAPVRDNQEDEAELDEDEILMTACPDVENLRDYIPEYFLDAFIDKADSKENQFATACVLLTALGATMSNLTVRTRREEFPPFLFVAIIGEAAAGKSVPLRSIWLYRIHADRVESKDKLERDKTEADYKKWKACVDKCKEEDCGCGPEPQRMSPLVLSCSSHISESKLTQILAGNRSYALLISESEMDRSMELKDFPLSAILRQLYEGEPVSSHTHAHGDITVRRPKAACVMAGTPGQLGRFFKNKENGLTSRFLAIFLPSSPYKPIAPDNAQVSAYYASRETLEERMRAFSTYTESLDIYLYLEDDCAREIDEYFEAAPRRFAAYSSDALISFIRRLRGMTIRMAAVLSVCAFYKDDGKTCMRRNGGYSLPIETVRCVLGWCDYLIEQHIRLLLQLPDATVPGSGNELKYKQAFDKLPCSFSLKEAVKIFEPYVKVSRRTVQRYLKKLVGAGGLRSESQVYYKVDCPDTVR